MALIRFTANFDDLSTDRGYQFRFRCDKCGNGFMSRFQTSVTGVPAICFALPATFSVESSLAPATAPMKFNALWAAKPTMMLLPPPLRRPNNISINAHDAVAGSARMSVGIRSRACAKGALRIIRKNSPPITRTPKPTSRAPSSTSGRSKPITCPKPI